MVVYTWWSMWCGQVEMKRDCQEVEKALSVALKMEKMKYLTDIWQNCLVRRQNHV